MNDQFTWATNPDLLRDVTVDERGHWICCLLNQIAVPQAPNASNRRIIFHDDTLRFGSLDEYSSWMDPCSEVRYVDAD
jgi:hypothetical protein